MSKAAATGPAPPTDGEIPEILARAEAYAERVLSPEIAAAVGAMRLCHKATDGKLPGELEKMIAFLVLGYKAGEAHAKGQLSVTG